MFKHEVSKHEVSKHELLARTARAKVANNKLIQAIGKNKDLRLNHVKPYDFSAMATFCLGRNITEWCTFNHGGFVVISSP
ncbi:hypothetical protein GCM10007877_29200 [Marinibactrum halimedae]|uniref:Uncharacterized protein n=1 Tax=Marinibactrum halimedae TaxID=1444977 RepID=A0AA37WPP8_9GAMM|nr:hypothetical protein GCM10007877_29200 [Marinibactrum halimedae]